MNVLILFKTLILLLNCSRSPDLSVSRLCSASSVFVALLLISRHSLLTSFLDSIPALFSYRLLLSACALAQSSSGGAASYSTAKTVSFSLQVPSHTLIPNRKPLTFIAQSLEPVAIQAMQLATNCLQPFATSPLSSPSSSSSSSSPSSSPHEMTLLLAHACLHFTSEFFSSYASIVAPPPAPSTTTVFSF